VGNRWVGLGAATPNTGLQAAQLLVGLSWGLPTKSLKTSMKSRKSCGGSGIRNRSTSKAGKRACPSIRSDGMSWVVKYPRCARFYTARVMVRWCDCDAAAMRRSSARTPSGGHRRRPYYRRAAAKARRLQAEVAASAQLVSASAPVLPRTSTEGAGGRLRNFKTGANATAVAALSQRY
jgi:hypothetical protein